jgi:hypothetical protein
MTGTPQQSHSVFDGFISGLGTTSGVRLVVGIWPRSPLGSFADVMVETAAGHRVLLAPRRDVADYVAETYHFDEIRCESIGLTRTSELLRITSNSLDLQLRIGGRPLLGMALWLVPSGLARARWWTSALDPIARTVLPGVRTRGSAGNNRREWYSALDLHRIDHAAGSFDGQPLGELAPVAPPVRFGFGSVPERPSIVRVATTVGQS